MVNKYSWNAADVILVILGLLPSACSSGAAAVAVAARTGVGVAGYEGYYSWNWGKGSSPPGGNNGVAFTGLTDVGKVCTEIKSLAFLYVSLILK